MARDCSTALEIDAPEAVREALAGLGRTEDVRFAPGGRRIAIAGYGKEQIAVAEVEVARSGSEARVAVTGLVTLGSPTLDEPHGLDFLDDETIVVGNRGGGVGMFRLPADGTGKLTPIGSIEDHGSGLLDSPGSIAVRSPAPGRYELLACNNWTNTVTRHLVDSGGAASAGEVVVARRLDLPDGLAVSDGGSWLAVSNHNTHGVLIYEFGEGPDAEPVGVLRGVLYPHGVRFADDDRMLVVADAGAPYVHVFTAQDGDWSGARYPARALAVMDDATFARGHHNPAEGGPKGIDVHRATNVLAATCEQEPLSFFDLEALDAAAPEDSDGALVRYELFMLDERDRISSETVAAREELVALTATRAWRMTAPVRRAYGAARKLRTRFRPT